MRIATMMNDVLKGLWRKPTTEQYPAERRDAPTRLRGKLTWDPDKCTGCCLCVKDCPSNALSLITIDKKEKRFVLEYHVDRCTFCAQCVQNCRFECIEMAAEAWELAATTKEPFTVFYGDEVDIDAVLAGIPVAEPEAV